MNSRSLLLITIFGCLPSYIFGQTVTFENRIVVVGSAVVTEKADQFSFRLRAKGNGSSLQASVETARKRVNDIVEKLRQLGFSETDFQTSHFTEGESSEKLLFSSRKDFEATIGIRVTSDKLNLLESSIITLSQMKVDVFDLSFSLKNDSEVTKKALSQAAENAKDKADLLARELNAKIERVLTIEETSTTPIEIRGGRANESGVFIDGFQQAALMGPFIYAESITRRASVRVVYSINK